METMEREPISSPGTKSEVSFRSSSSTTLNLSAPHYFSGPGVRAKDLFTHPGEWLEYRFTGEHLLGSIVQLLNMYSTFELMRNGIAKEDATRIYGGGAATLLSLWGFLSARGARPPEGKNFAQKAMDTFQHPEQSLIQFGWLLSFPISALMIYGDLYHGYKGQSASTESGLKRIGFSRIVQGGTKLLGSGLTSRGLLSDSVSKPVAFRGSNHHQQGILLRMKEVTTYALRTDKSGLLGRSLLLSTRLAKIYEAVKCIRLERSGITDPAARGGAELLRSSLIGLGAALLQYYYDYSRLYSHAPKAPALTPHR